jgi:hypothetical protein
MVRVGDSEVEEKEKDHLALLTCTPPPCRVYVTLCGSLCGVRTKRKKLIEISKVAARVFSQTQRSSAGVECPASMHHALGSWSGVKKRAALFRFLLN